MSKKALTEADVRRIVAEALRAQGPRCEDVAWPPAPVRFDNLPPGETFRYVRTNSGLVYVKLADGRTMCQQTGRVYSSYNSEVVCVCV